MIIDVFMFYDDFDMLDCRIAELSGVVDRFIAIEGNTGFSGIPKPYHLWEKRGRYEGVPLSIVRVDLANAHPPEVPNHPWISPGTSESWAREAWQRNGARELLDRYHPNAWGIYGDIDEIPRRSMLQQWVRQVNPDPVAFEMRMHVYSTSLVHPKLWAGSIVGRIGNLGTDVTFTRDRRTGVARVKDAGWHLSWFGKPNEREKKLSDHTHQELVPKVSGHVGNSLPRQKTHVDGETTLLPYDGTDFPSWIAGGHAPKHWTIKY
jgi:hypothetical protein